MSAYILRLMTKTSFKERDLLGEIYRETASKTVSEGNIYFLYREIVETRTDIFTLSMDYNSFLFPWL